MKGRYSPAECTGIKKVRVAGNPDIKHVSTSYVERQNLTMRMAMRRFTRLTNAFSKKLDNQIHALALYFVSYNFTRIHKTLRVSPAWPRASLTGYGHWTMLSPKLTNWHRLLKCVDLTRKRQRHDCDNHYWSGSLDGHVWRWGAFGSRPKMGLARRRCVRCMVDGSALDRAKFKLRHYPAIGGSRLDWAHRRSL